jgi:hypothetical protein
MKIVRPVIPQKADEQRLRKLPSLQDAKALHTICVKSANARARLQNRSASYVLPISSGYSVVRAKGALSERSQSPLPGLALLMRYRPKRNSAHGFVTAKRETGAHKGFHLALRGAARDIESRMSAAE